jgi:ankyrin repeat protein
MYQKRTKLISCKLIAICNFLLLIFTHSCVLADDDRIYLLMEAASKADMEMFESNVDALKTADASLVFDTLSRALLSDADDIVEVILDRGLTINSRDENGATPLMYAVRYRKLNIAKYLLDNGADIKSRDNRGLSLLQYAAAYGDYETVSFVIKAGLDVNDMTELGAPMHSASKNEYYADQVIPLLISEGANIEKTGKNGFTPYLLAIAYGNKLAIDTLKKAGADTSVTSKDGSTAFTLAIQFTNREILANLIADGDTAGSASVVKRAVETMAAPLKMDMQQTDHKKILEVFRVLHNVEITRPYIHAYYEPLAKQIFRLNEISDIDFVIELLGDDLKDIDHKKGLLVTAILNDNTSAVKKLIQHGVNVDPENSEYKHPLIAAAEYAGKTTFIVLANSFTGLTKDPENYFDAIDIIARHGDVDMMNALISSQLSEGEISRADLLHPFMVSVEHNRIDLVNYFINLGVDINTAEHHGKTPLVVAAKHGYLELSKSLIEHGAIDRPSELDVSAFDASISSNYPEITRLIYDRLELEFSQEALESAFLGALNYDNYHGLELLLEAGLDPSHQIRLTGVDASALSLLFLSLERKCQNMARLLINQGAEINQKMGLNVTHLGQAIDSGYSDIAKELIERGADVDAIYSRNGSLSSLSVPPLTGALIMGDKDLVAFLLDKSADPNVKDSKTLTPLFYADDVTTVQLLIEAGVQVNATGVTGRSPLLNAVLGANERLVKVLLDAGADPNKGVDNYNIYDKPANITPLIGSIVLIAEGSYEKEGKRILKLLLDHQADVNLDYSHRLRKPLDWALELDLPQVAKLLHKNGAVRRCYKGRVMYAKTDMSCDWTN